MALFRDAATPTPLRAPTPDQSCVDTILRNSIPPPPPPWAAGSSPSCPAACSLPAPPANRPPAPSRPHPHNPARPPRTYPPPPDRVEGSERGVLNPLRRRGIKIRRAKIFRIARRVFIFVIVTAIPGPDFHHRQNFSIQNSHRRLAPDDFFLHQNFRAKLHRLRQRTWQVLDAFDKLQPDARTLPRRFDDQW